MKMNTRWTAKDGQMAKAAAGLAVALILILGLVGVTGCGGELGAPTTTTQAAAGTASMAVAGDKTGHPGADAAAGPLSDEERTALLYLREEEKLAHDVYVTLVEKWGTRVFNNISISETRHTASMKTLLASYGVADPVGANPVGVFSDKELQQLFDSLVSRGGVSAAEALKVGIAIETKDIGDLERLVALTTHSDVRVVAQNLLNGSRNHLAAFSRGR
jgi:hypothetical protein